MAFIIVPVSQYTMAQTGNVGINTTNPTSTLHVKGKGNTSSTETFKLENSNGTNLFSVNDDGTVSGTVVSNLGSNGTGINGKNALVKTTTEASGTNCANGGIKVESGLDDNNNGILDASEVTGLKYVCNGTHGTNGTNGQGVPTGGTTGQVLSKVDATNYNTQWVTPAGGGSGATLVLQATKTTNAQILPNANGSGSGTQLTGDLVTYNNATTTVSAIGTYDSNGVFTVVQPGLYFVQAVTRSQDAATATNTTNQNLYVSINGGGPTDINSFHTIYTGANNTNYPAGVKGKGYTSGMYYLTAGQTVRIIGWSSNSSTAGQPLKTDGSCQLMIVKM
ncbi:DUF7151 family protein [Chryseobacterium sp. GP-SGM7]|uniref:DUF7151 family protein n=1 Tax=Chryseobacterium sp. GP-SGM7 TaxID=3411323 RepID=UPI003B9243A7